MTEEQKHPEGTAAADTALALAPMQAVAEATTAYYTSLVEGGIPAEVAGRMTEQYHSLLIDIAARSAANAVAAEQRKPRYGR